MRNRKPNAFFGLVGLALVLLALMLAIVPLVAQDVTTEEFEAECHARLLQVLAAKQEVEHGGANPNARLDDTIIHFLGHGCTWSMFDEPTATLAATTPPASTIATVSPVATTDPAAIPTATPDTAFVTECHARLLQVLAAKQEVEHGGANPNARLDDTIIHFLGYGCTWVMFEPDTTPTMTATAPVATTAAPLAPTATATPAVDPTATFEAGCYHQLQAVIYEQGRVDRGEKRPDAALDDAINNYLGQGCTWEMFE